MTSPKPTPSKLTRYATFFVVYLLGVILFGAWVRITHSGAGCGSHWPTCHGDIIPIAPSTETIIEYTHRLTSGMCGIFGIILLVWAWIKHKSSRVFWGALVTLLFVIFEGLIGAGIVLKELVTDDASVARAVVISIHLVNTLFLTGAASLTAWWSSPHYAKITQQPSERPAPLWIKIATVAALGVIALISMTGAITALGDTLFPVVKTSAGVLSRVQDDLGATKHFLVRLRIFHPIIAVASSLGLVALASQFYTSRRDLVGPQASSWALALMITITLQFVIGFANIALAAPGWIQLIHLLFAQIVWVMTLMMSANAITFSARSPRST